MDSFMMTLLGIVLVVSNKVEEVMELVKQGFCPVECSIGGASVVDALEMDHHGQYSGKEGVAIRAYRDFFGARKGDPRFVVVGVADADASFAIAALAGLLPHPSRAGEFEKAPPPVAKSMSRDLSDLASLVNRVDCDPIGVDLASMPGGDVLLAFNAINGGANKNSLGLAGAVNLWVSLTTGNPSTLKPLLNGAKESEGARRAEAKKDQDERSSKVGDVLIVENSRSWGFDVWYGRKAEGSPESPAGWSSPVVIALVESMSGITIGCPNLEVAESLFGKGGLKAVFPELDKAIAPGWGGREAIGGSPRGLKLTPVQARRAAEVVASLIKKS